MGQEQRYRLRRASVRMMIAWKEKRSGGTAEEHVGEIGVEDESRENVEWLAEIVGGWQRLL